MRCLRKFLDYVVWTGVGALLWLAIMACQPAPKLPNPPGWEEAVRRNATGSSPEEIVEKVYHTNPATIFEED